MSTLTIIKPRERVQKTDYYREFLWKNDPSGGFSFPCDEKGNLFPDATDAAKENYERALHDDRLEDFGIVKNTYNYTEPAIGKCSCGCEMEMIDQYMGAFECDDCGQWYNLSGQALEPVEKWNDYGELDYEY